MEIMELSLDRLTPHPQNNDFFDDITGGKWEDFLESIRTSGVIEPLVVTQDYTIVSGHQRYRAAKELGLPSLPCLVREYACAQDVLRDLIETNLQQRGIIPSSKQKQAKIIQTLEDIYGIRRGNNQHTNHNEEDSVNHTKLENAPHTQEELAEKLGLTLSQYKAAKALGNLIPELQTLVDEGDIPYYVASRLLSSLPQSKQTELVKGLDVTKRITQATLQRKIAEIQSHDADYQRKIEMLEKEVASYQEKIKGYQKELQASQEADKEGKLATLQAALSDAQTALAQAKENANHYMGELRNAKKTAAEMQRIALEKQKQEYEALLAQEKEKQGQRPTISSAQERMVDGLQVSLAHSLHDLAPLLPAPGVLWAAMDKMREEQKENLQKNAVALQGWTIKLLGALSAYQKQ